MTNSILEVMTYREELELIHMMDSLSEEMTDIIDFYGKDSVQVKEQKAYFRALTDVLIGFNNLIVFNTNN